MRPLIMLCAVALGVAGCSSVPSVPGLKPYRIDIQQGNYITQDMVAKLKPGMTKSQVRFVLGSPLITDAFHADRWDYVYWNEKGGKLNEQRKLTVVFEDDKLKHLEGDVVAAQPGAGQPVPAAQAPADKDKPKEAAGEKPQAEKGFFGRMWDKLGF